MTRTVSALALGLLMSSLWCAQGFGAPSLAPDPTPVSGAKHATISWAPYAYVWRRDGAVRVVVVGRPTGYAAPGVIYRFWNPMHGG